MTDVWGDCVIIQLPNPNGVEIVWTPAHAARLLSECWPVEYGAAYSTALNVCTDAMMGTSPREQARDAFIAAVDEAKIKKLR
ncbi:DUF982 domain-containing protein [Sinorhizobium numidicum]|uniref:DUF982 domain-containing protein n=1 Tax=Sinorhizobium numidicum TaxID=680248 RepID=A0ABY8CR15_9HYPH|nr:DUF982 domain-containing protein [Sinorhizobium numidicum]WEX75110.1 DUF982 domain-containing protein [Sinorhizobium numidicum]WEX81104.1 DUF982 domain-containing protein [Sinorhizobium numidicum]